MSEDLAKYAKVLVVGADGLGCELLIDLAQSGFQNLKVIDIDRIEVINLRKKKYQVHLKKKKKIITPMS